MFVLYTPAKLFLNKESRLSDQNKDELEHWSPKVRKPIERWPSRPKVALWLLHSIRLLLINPHGLAVSTSKACFLRRLPPSSRMSPSNSALTGHLIFSS